MKNEPAFPSRVFHEAHSVEMDGKPETRQDFPERIEYLQGMSIRDYFAAKAMQGWFSNGHRDGANYSQVARFCYQAADAMLKSREG